MAVPRHAKIVDTQSLGPDTKVLTFEMQDKQLLGFRGGQYIIVDSGLTLPNGKAAKRAYSMISEDARQDQFLLAVKRLDAGPVSTYLHGLKPGAEITFSGPWGKFYRDEASGNNFMLATDTGITCVIGFLKSTHFKQTSQTQLYWLTASDDYFLPVEFVNQSVPDGANSLHIEKVGPIGAAARDEVASRLVNDLDLEFTQFFLSGDGAVVYSVRDKLQAIGIEQDRIVLECYFNNPEKKNI